MPFRFAAKYGLLTYPQCGDLDPWAVNDMLGRLGAECVIGRENHQAGGVHLHAFFMFERKFESRNVRVFDVDGHHPNIVRGYSTPEDGWAYATKDGDVVAGALECPRPRTEVSESSSKWARAILAETREEFFAIVAELDPRALCVSFGSLRAYADWKYRPARDPYVTPEGISFDTSELPELDLWVQQTLSGLSTGKQPPPSAPLRGVPEQISARGCDSMFLRTALPPGAQSAHGQMSGYVPACHSGRYSG